MGLQNITEVNFRRAGLSLLFRDGSTTWVSDEKISNYAHTLCPRERRVYNDYLAFRGTSRARKRHGIDMIDALQSGTAGDNNGALDPVLRPLVPVE